MGRKTRSEVVAMARKLFSKLGLDSIPFATEAEKLHAYAILLGLKIVVGLTTCLGNRRLLQELLTRTIGDLLLGLAPSGSRSRRVVDVDEFTIHLLDIRSKPPRRKPGDTEAIWRNTVEAFFTEEEDSTDRGVTAVLEEMARMLMTNRRPPSWRVDVATRGLICLVGVCSIRLPRQARNVADLAQKRRRWKTEHVKEIIPYIIRRFYAENVSVFSDDQFEQIAAWLVDVQSTTAEEHTVTTTEWVENDLEVMISCFKA